MPWKREMSGLEPAAPNHPANRKRCALSTQPNPPSTKIDGSLVNFRRRLSNQHGRPRRMLIWILRRKHPMTVRLAFPSNVHINILRGLPCRLESLRLKITSEPPIFVDGDLAESIKRSASVTRWFGAAGLSPDFSTVFHSTVLLGLCLETFFPCTGTILSYPGQPPPPQNFNFGWDVTTRDLAGCCRYGFKSGCPTFLSFFQVFSTPRPYMFLFQKIRKG